jgi:hypothetical protein
METPQQQGRLEAADAGDYVEFFRTGTRVKGVFQCVSCAETVLVSGALPRCAACGESLWERGDWAPFAAHLHD